MTARVDGIARHVRMRIDALERRIKANHDAVDAEICAARINELEAIDRMIDKPLRGAREIIEDAQG